MKNINELVKQVTEAVKGGHSYQMAFTDLFMAVKPDMDKIVKSAVSKYTRTYNIDADTFEEAVHMAFLKAVDNFDPQKGEFVARLHHISSNLIKNVIRDSQADVRKAMTGSLSLNATLSENDDEVVTFQDQLIDTTVNIEQSVEEKELTVFDVLEQYKTISKKTKKEAELVEIYMAHEDDKERKEALMNYAGEGAKWVNVRKAVSRANQNFKKALQEAGKL